MVRIYLNRDQTEILKSLPETGMGYQKVDLTLRNGKILKGIIVLNCEIIDFPNSCFDIVEIALNKE